jgi:hypothetical protein
MGVNRSLEATAIFLNRKKNFIRVHLTPVLSQCSGATLSGEDCREWREGRNTRQDGAHTCGAAGRCVRLAVRDLSHGEEAGEGGGE